MEQAVLSSDLEVSEAPAAVPEVAGSRALPVRRLLHRAVEVMSSAAAAARSGLVRRRMERHRWMVDYQRLEEVREEAFLQMFRNGGLR